MGRSALALLDRCEFSVILELASPAEFAGYELLDDSTDPLFLVFEEVGEIEDLVFDSIEPVSRTGITITEGPRFNSGEIKIFSINKPDED